ncbi:hypothetical protein [Picosynechococcus sp. PCC 11901]|uniref:hypothetical protein n=1 Tax=Picosynechococcus sp. PCC 11901 TaxID=2579791 RepID=UPI00143DDB74|nr:hypothetical protein [Picosynechococcus sp. PCC 11901]
MLVAYLQTAQHWIRGESGLMVRSLVEKLINAVSQSIQKPGQCLSREISLVMTSPRNILSKGFFQCPQPSYEIILVDHGNGTASSLMLGAVAGTTKGDQVFGAIVFGFVILVVDSEAMFSDSLRLSPLVFCPVQYTSSRIPGIASGRLFYFEGNVRPVLRIPIFHLSFLQT